MKKLYRSVMIVVSLMLCSCMSLSSYVDEFNMKQINEECKKNIKDYNKLLRWREIENAGMLYMDRALRDDFLKNAEDIKKRGVTITDFRILTMECLADKKTADAVVEFDYYALPSNRINTLTYRQNWRYLGSEEKKGWMVNTALPAFD